MKILLEDMIESLPRFITIGKDKSGQDIFSGFTLKFKPYIKKWVMCYGTPKSNNMLDKEHQGYGDSPFEAIENFIKLIQKQNVKGRIVRNTR